MEIPKIIANGSDYFLPNLSIDLVIIGYQEGILKCLLLQLGEKWVLPGGYIKNEESVESAVTRILKERTNLDDPHFKFLSVFGAADREFGEEFKHYFAKRGLPWRDDYWINNRFVTLAYYSLVDIDNTHPLPGEFDEAAEWFSFDQLPELWLDHRAIVDTARNRLKEDSKKDLLTHNLLPQEFTMPELHRLHQTILETELDRSRFQKKMLSTGQFERLPKLKKDSVGRNPYRYRIKKMS